jgi:hypothetical protein
LIPVTGCLLRESEWSNTGFTSPKQ